MEDGKQISFDDIVTEIKKSIGELSVEERREIYKMYENVVDDSKVLEKNTGLQTHFNNIPKPIVISIYKYIQNKMAIKMNAIKYFPS